METMALDRALTAWEVPTTVATTDRLELVRHAVALAALAPSGHNTQPWRFTAGSDRVDLLADRKRRLPVVDPDDRALVISCGAALAHLRSALEHHGLTPSVELLPDPAAPDLLATLTLPTAIGETGAHGDEIAAMVARRTNRRPYDDRPLPDGLLADLQDRARAFDVWLRPVAAGPGREALADLIAEGDREQLSNPAFRRELATWIRHNHSPAGDGMRGSAFGIPGALSRLGPFVVRIVDTHERQATKDHDLALAAPAVVVLGTDGDTTSDWLATGQALAHVLLRATTSGLAAAFLNQPVEVAALRPRLAELLGADGVPQLVLRLGHGPEISPAPRRPLGEVLTIEEDPR
jgi:hypothetical protein